VRPVVVIPYRGTTPERARNLDHVMAQVLWFYCSPEVPTIPWEVGDSGDEPFSIARTWNHLAASITRRVPDWTHIIRWAADFILDDPGCLIEAIRTMDERGWHHVLPFTTATKLTEAETVALDQGEWPTRIGKLPYGGINITTREAWDALGGFDEGFKGWGHEDREYVHRLEAAFGPRQRTPGHLWLLHHPRNTDDPYWKKADHNHQLLTELTTDKEDR